MTNEGAVETPEQTEGTTTMVVTEKKSSGLGTALKIGAGLLVGAAFTGLGWILRGVFGGGHDDEDDEEESTNEETESEETEE